MNITEIKDDKELTRKLGQIHKSLTSAMEEEYDTNKFSYTEKEVGIMANHKTVNERIAFNRVKKIKALLSLSENWDNFFTLYKDDKILPKIGAEFLQDKFLFNNEILETIKSYPSRKEVLYYFKKDQSVEIGNVKEEDYLRIKEQILPALETLAQRHLQQKAILLDSVDKIMKDKSDTYNIKHPHHAIKLDQNDRINSEYGKELVDIKREIQKGNFTAKVDSNQAVVELPISGKKSQDESVVASSTIILKMNLANPKDYIVQVGSLESVLVKAKIFDIREKMSNSLEKTSAPKI